MADIVYDNPSDPNNAAPSYLKAKQDQEVADNLQWLQSQKFANQGAPTTPQPAGTPGAAPEAEPDPWAIRIFSDVARGIPELPRQMLLGGPRDAFQQTLDGMDKVAGWLNDNVAKTNNPDVFKVNLPEVAKPETATGDIGRHVSEFMMGFIPTLKAVRAVSGGKAIAAGARVLQGLAAGAIADATVMNPHEQRLSSLIENSKPFGIDLSNPVSKFLQADPNDGEAMARFKNALEGMGFGAAAEGLAHGIGAIRANRIAQGVKTGAEAGVEDTTPIKTTLGDPNGAVISRDVMDQVATKEIKPEDLGNHVNFAAAGQPDFIEKTVDAYSRAIKLSNDGRSLDDIIKEASGATPPVKKGYVRLFHGSDGEAPRSGWVSPDINYAGNYYGEGTKVFYTDVPYNADYLRRVQDVELMPEDMKYSSANPPTSQELPPEIGKTLRPYSEGGPLQTRIRSGVNSVAKEVQKAGIDPTEEAVNQIAQKLGVSPDAFTSAYSKIRAGKAVSRERVEGIKMFLGDLDKRVGLLAKQAVGTTDDAVLADFQKMVNLHQNVHAYYKGEGAAAGSLLDSFRNTTGSRAKQLAAMNDRFMQGGGPDNLRRLAKAINGMNDDDISKALAPTFGKKLTDTVVQTWYFNLLSGMKTQVANVASNALAQGISIPERFLAEHLAEWRGADDSVQHGEALAMANGFVKSMRDGIRAAGRTIKTGKQQDIFLDAADSAKEGKNYVNAISPEAYGMTGQVGSFGRGLRAFVDGVGHVAAFPTRAIMSEDEFFRVTGKSMELHAQATRMARQEGLEGAALDARVNQLVENPSLDMVDAAQDFTRSTTFSQPLGTDDIYQVAGQKVNSFVNRYPAFRLILPFVRTPINIMREGLMKRTPLGLLHSNIRAAIANGGPEADLAMSRLAIGSGVMLAAMDQVLQGNVTGAGPSDPTLQSNWRIKNQPFSIRNPLNKDEWLSYNRTDPLGLVLGMAATYSEVAGHITTDERHNLATDIAVAMSRSVLNKTWLKGPADFLDAMTQPGRYADSWMKKTAGTLIVPAFIQQANQYIDPVWRDVETTMDAIKSRIPGLSSTLPPRRNIWGEPIHMEGGLGPDIISPFYTQTDRKDPATEYIINNKIGLDLPTETQFGVKLTPQEYSEFVRRAGEPLHDRLNKAIDTGGDGWANGTDGPEGSRAYIIKKMTMDYRDAAKNSMVLESKNQNGDLYHRITQEATRKAVNLRGY